MLATAARSRQGQLAAARASRKCADVALTRELLPGPCLQTGGQEPELSLCSVIYWQAQLSRLLFLGGKCPMQRCHNCGSQGESTSPSSPHWGMLPTQPVTRVGKDAWCQLVETEEGKDISHHQRLLQPSRRFCIPGRCQPKKCRLQICLLDVSRGWLQGMVSMHTSFPLCPAVPSTGGSSTAGKKHTWATEGRWLSPRDHKGNYGHWKCLIATKSHQFTVFSFKELTINT